jgi:UDP-N-acetylmuramoyl-tripeptide--D-alanyl-D-alanine ligase
LATGFATDSRRVAPGDLFAALPGDNCDGHDYLEAAAQAGASGVLARESKVPASFKSCPVIFVEDPRKALGLVASRYRSDFIPAMIAVGGSNGKTTTKELIASILRTRWPAIWSEASFNNDIGVPLTLLRLERQHRAAVLEAGTNHPGEMAALLSWIRPKYGIVTNVGREHLEFFGGLEGVAREEGAMADALPRSGLLLVNGDSAWSADIASRSRARIARAGFGPENDWVASDLRMDETGVTFAVRAPSPVWSGEYRVPLVGKHQALNALFAIAIAAENRFTKAEIQAGLANCPQPKMRLQLKRIGGVGWLDDCYNSNPDSVAAALRTLADLPCGGRRFAVLGEMLELGSHSEAAHREAGKMAAETGVQALWTVGKWAEETAKSAAALGLAWTRAFAEPAEAASALARELRPGDLVLLKGSRGARLERIEQLWSRQTNDSAPPRK